MKKSRFSTKTLAVFLTVLLLLAVAPLTAMSDVLPKLDLDFDFGVTAHAEGEEIIASGDCGADGSDVLWSLDSDGTLTISGSGAMVDYTTVLTIVRSPWYSYRTQIFSIVVVEGIVSLGNYAFAGLASVESISLPETLQSIGNSAFVGCTALKTIVVPDSVTEIGTKAFGYSSIISSTAKISDFVMYGIATGITKDYAQENDVEFYCSHRLINESDCIITEEETATCTEKGTIHYQCVVCNESWTNSTPMLEHTFDDGVINEAESNDAEIVTDYTCIVCGFVNSVTTEIPIDESYMLSGYCGDTSNGGDGKNIKWRLNQETGVLTLNGTGKMGSTPNRADNRVKKIVVCEGITEIAAYAFCGCNNNEEVVLPSTMTTIGQYAFDMNYALSSVDFGGVKKIQDYAFYRCKNIDELVLPNTLTEIGDYAFYLTGSLITHLEIPGSVKTIGSHAFYNYHSLRTLILNEGIEVIKEYAFSHDPVSDSSYLITDVFTSQLTELVIPNSVKRIGERAFSSLKYLQSLTLGTGITKIESEAFYNDFLLQGEIILPECCEYIGKDVFEKTNYSSLSFGKNVSYFMDQGLMQSLTTIEVSADNPYYTAYDNVVYKKDYSKLIYPAHQANINLPDGFPEQEISVGKTNSTGCNFLTKWDFIENINISENNLFYKSESGILYTKDGQDLLLCPQSHSDDVIIPFGCERIFVGAFYQCKNITNISFPATIETIMANAFHCTTLKSIIFEEGLKTIEYRAFLSCTDLNTLMFPDSLETIDSQAFENCTSLSTVSFGAGLKTIGFSAFEGTRITGNLILPDSCESVGESVFNGTDITYIYIGKNLSVLETQLLSQLESVEVSEENECFSSYDGVLYNKEFSKILLLPVKNTLNLPEEFKYYEITNDSYQVTHGNFLMNYSFIKRITVSDMNPYYKSIDGILYSKDGSTLILCPQGREDDVIVAGGTENIGPFAFWACADVKSVLLPNGLRTIGVKSFSGNTPWGSNPGRQAITSEEITIPSSVELIDRFAFQYGHIYKVVLNEGIREIGSNAFEWSALNEINIPCSLQIIGQSSFSYTNIKSVIISSNIVQIGNYAFDYARQLESLEVYSPFIKNLVASEFRGASALKRLVLGDSFQLIGMDYISGENLYDEIIVYNRYTGFKNYNSLNPSQSGTITGYCGSPAHEMAIKRLFNWNSLGHTWLNWYVAEPATFDHDGVEKRDCAYCGESEERVIPKLEQETFTATFVADGRVVASVDFQKGTTAIDEPAVPARDRYTSKWEDYILNDEDITINAIYTLIKSDDAQEIETDSTIEHYTEKDNVLFRVKATSAAKIVKSVVSQSIPLDIVLVVDQSGSMDDTLGGTTKKVDALKEAANSFITSVAENARLTGASHRIGIVGFGLAGSYSGYQTNENTELLTGARGIVNYSDVTPADYASALLPVLNGDATNAALTDAVAAIEARGATAADLGLEMAKGVFANSESTGRDRVVIFMTDGEPTYTNGFQNQVANSAVYNAGLLKKAYNALVYSVGIFGSSESENLKIKSFMNAVSSNYPDAKTYTSLGAAASDVFSITASHTDALNDVFRTITTESLSHTAPFDNVTLIKTLSPYVTLTAPQEETLRINVIRQYGISNDQISITCDDQGRTQIRIDGLTPYEVIDDEGNITYEVAIEFFASLNENAAAAGTYAVDTDDSGIMLGDNAIGYEATFSTNELTLSAKKTRYIFTINGEIYEIAEGSSVSAAIPETDFSADWQFSGWNTAGVSNVNGTIIDATLVKAPRTVIWHTADGDIQQIYTEGAFLTPPEVADRADGSRFLSWDKSLPTVMLDQNLEFTAVYGPHIHRYTSELTPRATCTTDGLLTYTCMCGDTYTETVDAIGHNYEAITATGDSDPSRCTFVCTNCGDRYEYALNYQVVNATGHRTNVLYEFELTNDDLETGMQPNGSIDVRVPLNEFQGNAKHVKVRRNVNGVWEDVPARIEDGFLVITADHFTPYDVKFTFDCNETGNHSWGEGVETKSASCTEEGIMTYTCETCEETMTEPINKKDHTPGDWFIDQAATCKETGSKHQECAVCHGTIATETIEKNAGNHADYGTRIENSKAATCKEDGYTGDTYCKGCNSKLANGSTISKDTIAHTPGAVEKENVVAATTDHGGSYDEVVRCTVCGKVLSSTHKTTDKLPSQPQSNPNACKYCGEVHSGAFGWLIKFFHSILAAFGLRK